MSDASTTLYYNLQPAPGLQQSLAQQFSKIEQGLKFNLPFNNQIEGLKNFTSELERANQRVITLGLAFQTLRSTQQLFTGIVSSALEVEKAFTEINSVFELTSKQIDRFGKDLFQVAKQTSTSFQIAAEAAKEFSRQGLSSEETLSRTKNALTLARVANLDVAKAVDVLTASINGFTKAGISSADVTNKLLAVDTRFAVSVKDLSEALARAGASASDAGVGFDELLGIITAVQQTTARGGAVIGQSLKTIFTRIERKDTLDSLEALGVRIRDVQGNILPAMQLLENFSSTYDQLGESTKKSAAELVGGVYQINILKAAIADLSKQRSVYAGAVEASKNAGDEELIRNEALNKSLQSTIDRLALAGKQIGSNVANLGFSNFAKIGINLLANNPITRALEDASGNADSLGGKIAENFIKGFGNSLVLGLGPIFTVALAKITSSTFSKIKNDLFEVAGITASSKEQLMLQEQINFLYKNGDAGLKAQLATMTSLNEKAQFLASQLAQIQARSAAAQSETQAVSSIILQKKLYNPIPKSAGGYVPFSEESSAISNGVGGAPGSASPRLISNFNFGNGKVGPIVANTSEYIVPNFSGGGSAIFNQDMISQYGLPPGAMPIGAGGYIPYAARGGSGNLELLKRELLRSRNFSSIVYQKENGEIAKYSAAQWRVRNDELVGAPPPKGYSSWTEYQDDKQLLVLRSIKEGETEPQRRSFKYDRIKQINAQGQTYNFARGYIPNAADGQFKSSDLRSMSGKFISKQNLEAINDLFDVLGRAGNVKNIEYFSQGISDLTKGLNTASQARVFEKLREISIDAQKYKGVIPEDLSQYKDFLKGKIQQPPQVIAQISEAFEKRSKELEKNNYNLILKSAQMEEGFAQIGGAKTDKSQEIETLVKNSVEGSAQAMAQYAAIKQSTQEDLEKQRKEFFKSFARGETRPSFKTAETFIESGLPFRERTHPEIYFKKDLFDLTRQGLSQSIGGIDVSRSDEDRFFASQLARKNEGLKVYGRGGLDAESLKTTLNVSTALANNQTLFEQFNKTVQKNIQSGKSLNDAYIAATSEIEKHTDNENIINNIIKGTQPINAAFEKTRSDSLKVLELENRERLMGVKKQALLNKGYSDIVSGLKFDELNYKERGLIALSIRQDAIKNAGFGNASYSQIKQDALAKRQVDNAVEAQIALLNSSQASSVAAKAGGKLSFKENLKQNAGLIAAMGLPFLSAFVPEGRGGTASGMGSGFLTGALNGAGFGASIGTMFGIPGTAIGAGIGATIGGAIGLISKMNASFEEMTQKMEDAHRTVQQDYTNVINYLNIQDPIKEALKNKQYATAEDLQNQSNFMLSGITNSKYLDIISNQNLDDRGKRNALSDMYAETAKKQYAEKAISQISDRSGRGFFGRALNFVGGEEQENLPDDSAIRYMFQFFKNSFEDPKVLKNNVSQLTKILQDEKKFGKKEIGSILQKATGGQAMDAMRELASIAGIDQEDIDEMLATMDPEKARDAIVLAVRKALENRKKVKNIPQGIDKNNRLLLDKIVQYSNTIEREMKSAEISFSADRQIREIKQRMGIEDPNIINRNPSLGIEVNRLDLNKIFQESNVRDDTAFQKAQLSKQGVLKLNKYATDKGVVDASVFERISSLKSVKDFTKLKDELFGAGKESAKIPFGGIADKAFLDILEEVISRTDELNESESKSIETIKTINELLRSQALYRRTLAGAIDLESSAISALEDEISTLERQNAPEDLIQDKKSELALKRAAMMTRVNPYAYTQEDFNAYKYKELALGESRRSISKDQTYIDALNNKDYRDEMLKAFVDQDQKSFEAQKSAIPFEIEKLQRTGGKKSDIFNLKTKQMLYSIEEQRRSGSLTEQQSEIEAARIAAARDIEDRTKTGRDVESSSYTYAALRGKSGDSLGSFTGGFGSVFSGIRKDMGQLADLGRDLANSLQNSLGNAFGDFVTGAKTAKEAFRSFVVSVLADASRAFASKAVQSLLGMAFNSFGVPAMAAPAGATGGEFSGGAFRFAAGGTVPALLTGGEYYISPKAAKSIGYDTLRQINRYAEGGMVRGGSGVRDDVPARLAPGSFIVKKSVVDRLGPQYFDSLINNHVQKRFFGGMLMGALLGGGLGYAVGGKKGALIGAGIGAIGGGFYQNFAQTGDILKSGSNSGMFSFAREGVSPAASGATLKINPAQFADDIDAGSAQQLLGNTGVSTAAKTSAAASPLKLFGGMLATSAVLGLAARAMAPKPEAGPISLNQVPAYRANLEAQQQDQFSKNAFAYLTVNPQGGYSLGSFGVEPATRRWAEGGEVGGVSDIGMASSNGQTPSVNVKIEINNNGQVSSTTSASGRDPFGPDFGQKIEKSIRPIIQDEIVRQMRNDGIFMQRSRYS